MFKICLFHAVWMLCATLLRSINIQMLIIPPKLLWRTKNNTIKADRNNKFEKTNQEIKHFYDEIKWNEKLSAFNFSDVSFL